MTRPGADDIPRRFGSSPSIDAELVDGVLTVRLGGPETRDRIVSEMFLELGSLFDAVALDDEVRVVVLTGAGERFSTGGDVSRMGEKRPASERYSRTSSVDRLHRMYRNLLAVDQPVIAAVNGDAAGAGATLALHCDIVLAAAGARIGDPHVKRGLVASAGPYIWPLMTSLNIAKEYLLTGDPMPVEEAWRVGLVNHVYPPDELPERTRELASKLAGGAPLAIRWTKRLLNRAAVHAMNELFDDGIGHELVTFETEDHREGVASFLEKRDPVFRGR